VKCAALLAAPLLAAALPLLGGPAGALATPAERQGQAGPAPGALAQGAQAGAITVFAAASLTDAFREIGGLLEVERGIAVTFNFGASSALRTQLEQGATADVFASADQAQMDRARAAGTIAGPDVTFATNRLVIIAPKSNPGGISGPADLANPGLRLVTAGPEVPIGVYTQTMLEQMSQDPTYGADFKDRANANVVSREPNVRQVVAKVQLGEADAAVVYVSDVTPAAAPDLVSFEIPDALNTIASYPIALVRGGPNADGGQTFVDFVLSPVGQGILARWRLIPAGPVARTPADLSALFTPSVR
jgi:molybdate transport system substrate-binding protein